MNLKNLLMIKFYVVDGISYPAAETAVGHFGGHGYVSMKACRDVGIENANYKASMNSVGLISFIFGSASIDNKFEISDIDVNPSEYYLENNGFGVQADKTELLMAKQYLVSGIPYTRIEELAKIKGRKGFEAMYAVCKLGGFYGGQDKGSMDEGNFSKRKKILHL